MKTSRLTVPLMLVCAFSAHSQTHASPKVCVAQVANASTVSAHLERLAGRLVQDLTRSKLQAEAMDSSTTMDGKLRPTIQNGNEAKDKDCDYTLLTQIVDTRSHLSGPNNIPRDGARVPSTDASDPMGGQSGPVYRENMQINFALFHDSRPDPVTDTYILERATANVSDTFLQAMDRIANRVSHDLKKK